MVELKKLVERLEKAYADEKTKECEELHNAIAEMITQKKPTIQNILFVLRLIEFELLYAEYQRLLGNVVVPPGGGVKIDAKLATGEAKD